MSQKNVLNLNQFKRGTDGDIFRIIVLQNITLNSGNLRVCLMFIAAGQLSFLVDCKIPSLQKAMILHLCHSLQNTGELLKP